MLHEPMLLRRFGDGREQRIRQSLLRLGITLDDSPEQCTRGTIARRWYEEHVIPQFKDYQFWGLKEVYLTDAEQLIRDYAPDQILLLWRDPRDVALSFLELMNRSLMCYPDGKTLKDEAWALECLRASAETLSRIAAAHPHLMLRYEDLIRSPQHRQSILHHVGLSDFGQQSIAMVEDAMEIRSAEVRKHQQRLSDRSIGRWREEPPGWRRMFASVCHAVMHPHAARAGYEQPLLRTDDVCAAATRAAELRLADPQYDPAAQFDFAYARRRARRKVAGLLTPGSRLLDVGASTAALAFLVDQVHVTAVDDGAEGKRLLSKPWRQGVLPKLDQFDTATFLFSLEYLAEPLRMIQALLQRGLRVIATYHCLDDFPRPQRETLQFASHVTRDQWVCLAAEHNAGLLHEWCFDGFQSLLDFKPPRTD